MGHSVTQLYPTHARLPLTGLYLRHALHQRNKSQSPFVYTNYIASLDGRIAVADSHTNQLSVPGAITNPRDWRLYQELAAQADVLITSARYIRELASGTAQDTLPVSSHEDYADLHAWRRQHDLPAQPAVVILSGGNDLPLDAVHDKLARPFYVAAGDEAAATLRAPVERRGGKLLSVGAGKAVDGKQLIASLAAEGFHSIYAISGPQVLKTLVNAGVLNRLYLTQVHRLIGGAGYSTLLESDLAVPANLELAELYYDTQAIAGVGQLLGVYDVK